MANFFSHRPGFNPTLVRLRRSEESATAPSRPCFNPTLVRLRPEETHARAVDEVLVSIPRWFD